MSGFLICSKLVDEEAAGGIDLKAFYVRRAFRILPPAFLYLGVVALLGVVGVMSGPGGQEILSSALFFRNYRPLTDTTGHFWSLSVEEHFYLFWPLLMLLFGSRTMRRIAP